MASMERETIATAKLKESESSLRLDTLFDTKDDYIDNGDERTHVQDGNGQRRMMKSGTMEKYSSQELVIYKPIKPGLDGEMEPKTTILITETNRTPVQEKTGNGIPGMMKVAQRRR